MRVKKFLSVMLALVMALALAVPAMAEGETATETNQIIHTGDRNGAWEYQDSIEGYSGQRTVQFTGEFLFVKQATDGYLWVSEAIAADYTDNDGNLDTEAIKSAYWNYCGGTNENGAFVVVTGEEIHDFQDIGKGKDTRFQVANGTLTIWGVISHLNAMPYTIPEPDDPDDGKTHSTLTIQKVVVGANILDGFQFAIYNSNNEQVGTMTSDELGTASFDIENLPAGRYTIKEIKQNLNLYEENTEVLTADVDAERNVTFVTAGDKDPNTITNYALGALEIDKPVVMQKYDELWHQLVYGEFTESTLVGHINPLSGAKLPACITDSGYMNNGFTWFQIDPDQLAAEANGVDMGIALSNKSGGKKAGVTGKWNTPVPSIAPANPWEDPIPATYNLKVVDGKLVVTSTLPNFRVTFSGVNQIPAHTGAHVGDGCYTAAYDLPAGEFRMAIHFENNGYSNANDVLGCDPTTVLRRECERQIDPSLVNITVTDAASEDVTTKLDKLPQGDYTVTVTACGKPVSTQTVTVNPGQTTSVTYDEPLYMEKGADEYRCGICGWFTPIAPALPVEP